MPTSTRSLCLDLPQAIAATIHGGVMVAVFHFFGWEVMAVYVAGYIAASAGNSYHQFVNETSGHDNLRQP